MKENTKNWLKVIGGALVVIGSAIQLIQGADIAIKAVKNLKKK